MTTPTPDGLLKRLDEAREAAVKNADYESAATARDAHEEIRRLLAIVEKLPKTADGVPVFPGSRVYRVDTYRNGVVPHLTSHVHSYPVKNFYPDGVSPVEHFYSTRAAALVAAAAEGGMG